MDTAMSAPSAALCVVRATGDHPSTAFPWSFVSPAGTPRRPHGTSLCRAIQPCDLDQGSCRSCNSRPELCYWFFLCSTCGLVSLVCLLPSRGRYCVSRGGRGVHGTSCPIGHARTPPLLGGPGRKLVQRKRRDLCRALFRWRGCPSSAPSVLIGILSACVFIAVGHCEAPTTSISCDKQFHKRTCKQLHCRRLIRSGSP